MPFVYEVQSKSVLENYTTNGSGNTENEFLFLKPGATRALALLAFRVLGKGAGLTALSGIAFRLKQWITTAGAGGTAITPAPVDNRAPAAACTAGAAATAAGVVTAGTGGPNMVGGCGCGASGPGGWVAPNLDSPPTLDGGANKSIDAFSSSGTASLNFEFWSELQE